MAKAFVVGNPIGKRKSKGKKKSKKRAPSARPKRKARSNPLEAIITGAGFNPHRKGKSMAKKKSKKSGAGARNKNPFKKKNGGHRHRHAARNPLLPVESKRLPGLVTGGLLGAIGSSWVPALVLPSVTSWLSFLLNAAVAILGAWGLTAVGAPNAALGFLIGGLSATAGLVLDKVTGKQIISVSAPMGQFYRQSGAYLPSGMRSDLTNNPFQAALPAVIPAAGSQKAHAAKTMGWSQMRRRAG